MAEIYPNFKTTRKCSEISIEDVIDEMDLEWEQLTDGGSALENAFNKGYIEGHEEGYGEGEEATRDVKSDAEDILDKIRDLTNKEK